MDSKKTNVGKSDKGLEIVEGRDGLPPEWTRNKEELEQEQNVKDFFFVSYFATHP